MLLTDGFPALEVGYDRQCRGKQHQNRQRCYHAPDNAASPPLLTDILAFDFVLGDLADGRRERGALVPEPGVAQGQARVTAGPAHIEIYGLSRENTMQR